MSICECENFKFSNNYKTFFKTICLLILQWKKCQPYLGKVLGAPTKRKYHQIVPKTEGNKSGKCRYNSQWYETAYLLLFVAIHIFKQNRKSKLIQHTQILIIILTYNEIINRKKMIKIYRYSYSKNCIFP